MGDQGGVSNGHAASVSPGELAQQLIRFDTASPGGRERELIAWLAPQLEAAGLEVRVLARDPERPNIVARLRGRGEAPPLLLHGHIDVVPVTGQKWSVDPFAGTIEDGVLWGRGALDMKGGVAMLLAAVLRAAAGPPPAGDLILCVLSDEERGGDLGALFLVEEHAGLFTGARHAIGEFGGFSFPMIGKRVYPIQVAEKQRAVVRLIAEGDAGHGALGGPGSAVTALAQSTRRIGNTGLPVHITPVAGRMLEEMGDAVGSPLGGVMRALGNERISGTALRVLGDRAAAIGPMLRNTATVTHLAAGDRDAINVVPAEAEANLDCRVLPGYGPDDLLAELRPLLAPGVRAEVTLFERADPAIDWSLYPLLAGLLRDADPTGHPVPMLLAGVTDGRHFARLGIQHHGFLPMQLPPDLGFQSLLHAADERVPVAALDFGADILTRLLATYPG
ncbi:MAG TPA: M20/M25/M40 family metallo-hydrolase [Solirubrobacterales bacterium]|jgi:acetylornithine deacetylase/succinyl-diaminopimelate desuccinylase-like protein